MSERQREYINQFRRWLHSRKVEHRADLFAVYLYDETVKVDFRIRENGTLISWLVQSQLNTGPGSQKRPNLSSSGEDLYKAAAAVHHNDNMLLKAREASEKMKARELDIGKRAAESFMLKIEDRELPIRLKENQIVISDTLVLDFGRGRVYLRGPITPKHLEILLGVDECD